VQLEDLLDVLVGGPLAAWLSTGRDMRWHGSRSMGGIEAEVGWLGACTSALPHLTAWQCMLMR
jgi:hypothetical protein